MAQNFWNIIRIIELRIQGGEKNQLDTMTNYQRAWLLFKLENLERRVEIPSLDLLPNRGSIHAFFTVSLLVILASLLCFQSVQSTFLSEMCLRIVHSLGRTIPWPRMHTWPIPGKSVPWCKKQWFWHLLKNSTKDYIQGTTAVGPGSRGERLGSTPKAAWNVRI